MKPPHRHDHDHGCGCCRGDFLGAMGLAAGGIALHGSSLAAAEEPGKAAAPKKGPATVRGAFLYPPSATLRVPGAWWSYPGNDFDAEGRQKQYMVRIKEIEKKLGMRILIDETPLDAPAGVAQFVDEVKQSQPDGLLLIPFKGGHFSRMNQILKELKIPTVILSSLGVTHGSVKAYRRPGLYFIQSLDNLDAVEYGMRMIKTAHTMRQSRLISLAGSAEPRLATVPRLGTQVWALPLKRFVEEVGRTPVTDEVRQLARSYVKNAKRILEPAEPEIITAAKVHFANKRILEAEQGDAIMMDCLRRGELMPCMSYMTLRDEGIAAGCQNDLNPTLTLMLVQHLFDRPGFLQNYCVETEQDHYFGSHCTCASKLFGTAQPPEPYLLRNYPHTNDPTCCPQVLWREGEEVTMALYISGEAPQMLVYTGEVVKCYDMPPVGGCRTNVQITINEVEDICDVKPVHHQIIFYGNYAEQLRKFAQLYNVAVLT